VTNGYQFCIYAQKTIYLSGTSEYLTSFLCLTMYGDVAWIQVEERRAGLENWLKAVLMPSCARAARDAAAKGVASPSGGAAAAAKDDRDDTGNSQADKPVPVPIKNLMWVFLRLDTRVTHL